MLACRWVSEHKRLHDQTSKATERFLADYFREHNLEVEEQPVLKDDRTPDLLVKPPDHPPFYVECKNLLYPRNKQDYYRIKNKEPLPSICIHPDAFLNLVTCTTERYTPANLDGHPIYLAVFVYAPHYFTDLAQEAYGFSEGSPVQKSIIRLYPESAHIWHTEGSIDPSRNHLHGIWRWPLSQEGTPWAPTPILATNPYGPARHHPSLTSFAYTSWDSSQNLPTGLLNPATDHYDIQRTKSGIGFDQNLEESRRLANLVRENSAET